MSFVLIEIFPELQSVGINLYSLAFSFGIVLLVLSPKRLFILCGINWGILILFCRYVCGDENSVGFRDRPDIALLSPNA